MNAESNEINRIWMEQESGVIGAVAASGAVAVAGVVTAVVAGVVAGVVAVVAGVSGR